MAVQLSRGRSRRGNAEINVTPFVDVVLVLLIIFMVTAPLMLQGMDVNLPETMTQPIRMPNAPLVLTVTKEGQYSLARKVIPPDELQAQRPVSACSDAVVGAGCHRIRALPAARRVSAGIAAGAGARWVSAGTAANAGVGC